MASVEGRSMQPTINPVVEGKNLHEWVLVSKLGVKKYAYNRGDVVMLKYGFSISLLKSKVANRS